MNEKITGIKIKNINLQKLKLNKNELTGIKIKKKITEIKIIFKRIQYIKMSIYHVLFNINSLG